MIGAVSPTKSNEASFFTGFVTQFPTADQRRLGALGLLPTNDGSQFPTTYATRSVLAAHWAETDRESKQRAIKLYKLVPTLVQHKGKSVISLEGCSPTDINPGNELPAHGLTIDFATVATDEPDYSFRRTPPNKLPSDVSDACCLDYRVSFAARNATRVTIDPLIGTEVSPITGAECDIVAFSGTVSLEKNRDLYERISTDTTPNSLIFGNGRAFDFLKRFTTMLGGDFQERFDRRVAEGSLALGKPLQQIDTIFS